MGRTGTRGAEIARAMSMVRGSNVRILNLRCASQDYTSMSRNQIL